MSELWQMDEFGINAWIKSMNDHYAVRLSVQIGKDMRPFGTVVSTSSHLDGGMYGDSNICAGHFKDLLEEFRADGGKWLDYRWGWANAVYEASNGERAAFTHIRQHVIAANKLIYGQAAPQRRLS